MAVAPAKRPFALETVSRLRDAGHTALWAGGCVRDLLMGRTPQDYDIATSALPEEVRTLFGKRRTLAVGASFGVIVVLGPPGVGPIEVATFRTDGSYHDGRRPASVVYSSPEQDAQRRDFTINGMFYDPLAEKVFDYVGGQLDLQRRRIRAIGDPHRRFTEDKLRMLRAVRFTATLEFDLDPATAAAVAEMAAEVRAVSAERITQELQKMLASPQRCRALELCRELRLLSVVLPELGCAADPLSPSTRPYSGEPTNHWADSLVTLAALRGPSFPLALAALFGSQVAAHAAAGAQDALDLPRAAGARLKLSNDQRERLTEILELQVKLQCPATLSLAKLKRLLAQSAAEEAVQLLRARVGVEPQLAEPAKFLEDFLQATPRAELNPSPLLTGADLIAAGLSPGPRFRTLLEAARDLQLEGRLQSRDQSLAWLAEQSARD